VVIKIENVTKMYGPTVAVKDVSFEVEKGEILGFLGPNGAGKTTTMRVITGYFPPTLGNAYIAGHSVLDAPLEVKKRIGYVPETPAMYSDMLVKEYIRYIGALKGVPKTELKERVERIIATCALESVSTKNIGSLSKGFKQRAALAQALVNDPPVLILDEPTSGLDPKQIHEIRSLIKSMEGERTIILSTHILPEVSMTCSKVVIINEGIIVAADTTENIGRSLTESHQVELTVGGDPARVKETVSGIAGVGKVSSSGNHFVVDSEKDRDLRAEIARKVVEGGFDLLEMRAHSMTLEDVYLKLVTEEEGVRQ
jgi:ABC-2 type transport system ATP-binding protein